MLGALFEGIWKDREKSIQPYPDHVGSAVFEILRYRKKGFILYILGYRVF